ncbi:MAG: hypothetical protein C0485_19690 [Pirellula sp.]|nr:hypothetical protein [Pirellula sp.]
MRPPCRKLHQRRRRHQERRDCPHRRPAPAHPPPQRQSREARHPSPPERAQFQPRSVIERRTPRAESHLRL